MKTNAYSGKVSFPAGDDQPTVQKAIKKPELVKMEKKINDINKETYKKIKNLDLEDPKIKAEINELMKNLDELGRLQNDLIQAIYRRSKL